MMKRPDQRNPLYMFPSGFEDDNRPSTQDNVFASWPSVAPRDDTRESHMSARDSEREQLLGEPESRMPSEVELRGDIAELIRIEVENQTLKLRNEVLKLSSRIAHLEALSTHRDVELADGFDPQHSALMQAEKDLASYQQDSGRASLETQEELDWTKQWLDDAESGELDIYTCLGLSNCFSWTPDTRKIMFKAIAVTFLQMLVPFNLLVAESETGIELGPAVGDWGFRLTGFTLYGYAIYNMYNGAFDSCRTSLLNMLFQVPGVSMGNWLPLVIGELSNTFTAMVLVVALYSIFTTQTAPADLILNAVAVNFLGDCDGSFVDKEMKADAVRTFKEMSEDFFTGHVGPRPDPLRQTGLSKAAKTLLYLTPLVGALGCGGFLLYPVHLGGMRDTTPGFSHNVQPL